ncbi:MAG: hypothetical protein FWH40_01135 [Coriobacteriia bacterium]|nr:hypothetical protein [Coriobacteriia bacterium]
MHINQKARTPRKKILSSLLAVMICLMVVVPSQMLIAAEFYGPVPTGVEGRVLTPDMTGDTVNWVEIARSGNSSLIVRTDYLKKSYKQNEPTWHSVFYGTTNNYLKSQARDRINNWFNGNVAAIPTPNYDVADDTLAQNARMREFTLQSNATAKLGTSYTETTLTDGLSQPSDYQVGVGNDIAFMLSSSEVANFLSNSRVFKGGTSAQGVSPAEAKANFAKMSMPAVSGYTTGMWLRSTGSTSTTVGALYANGFAQMFEATTLAVMQKGYVYPAVWVENGIFTTAPVDTGKPIAEYATVVDGRILAPEMTGDSCNWVEIAQNGDYSLIVRADFMNIQSFNYGNPMWQNSRYSIVDNNYSNSYIRGLVNIWFNRLTPIPDPQGINTFYDVLPANARIREFTVQNSAINTLGTRYTTTTLYDGLSNPTKYQVGIGNDIAFALSYSEVANYCSIVRNWKGAQGAECYSSPEAVSNFYKINIPATEQPYKGVYYYGMWLRSPGSISDTACALLNDGYAHELRLFSEPFPNSFGYGLVFPAVWVGQGIFKQSSTVIVEYVDAITGDDIISPDVNIIPAGDYGEYFPKDLGRYGYRPGMWDPRTAPVSGTISMGETITIRFLYLPSGVD